MHFLGDILHILGGFRGKFCLLGGHFGPGPRQDKDFVVEYTPMGLSKCPKFDHANAHLGAQKIGMAPCGCIMTSISRIVQ